MTRPMSLDAGRDFDVLAGSTQPEIGPLAGKGPVAGVAMGLVKEGKVKPLAVSTPKRIAALPEAVQLPEARSYAQMPTLGGRVE